MDGSNGSGRSRKCSALYDNGLVWLSDKIH